MNDMDIIFLMVAMTASFFAGYIVAKLNTRYAQKELAQKDQTHDK